MIGYAGPARILDAALLRDSLYIGLRRDDFAVTGPLRPSEGLGVDGLRFLLRPYDFGPAWIREALERADMEPSKEGWRLRGEGRTSAGPIAFTLDVNGAGEPRRLELSRRGDGAAGESAIVRYGALRGFGAGRYPRWIEWERGGARVRLDLRDVDPLPGGGLRLLAPPPPDWRVVGLDDEEGRSFLKRLLGQSAEGASSAPPPEGTR